MPDPIRKHFGYSQLGPYIHAGSDFPHLIWFRFSKEGMGHSVQNRPGSDLDGLARVWLNSSGLKASWWAGTIRPGFWQEANGLLPVSHFQTQFCFPTDIPDNIIQNQPGSDLVLVDCARFGPNRSGLEESQCARTIWPASGQCFLANPVWMRTGSSMFTGILLLWSTFAERYSLLLSRLTALMSHVILYEWL